MAVQVKVLGGFEVVVEGVVLPADVWRRRHAAGLVKLLALADGHRMHREQVVDALWPDLAPASAAPRLHKAAHYARAALGLRNGVALSGDMVWLLPDGDLVVDLDLFDSAAADAEAVQHHAQREGPAGELIDEARRRADEAVERYAGDLLPDDLYETWADGARESRRLMYFRLLRQAGRWEELAASDPANEEAHLRVAHMLAQRGDRTAALRRLDLLEQKVRDELGVEPGPTADRLRQVVLALPEKDPSSADLAFRRAATLVQALPVRIIGRERELTDALALLDRSRILTLMGPGGVGKTTVAIELARRRADSESVEACFVDLTKVSHHTQVAALVATELGIHHASSNDPHQQLKEALWGRRLILVLDNFEHVIEAADIVPRLASWSQGLAIICTSRTRLQVSHEQVLEVTPFEVSLLGEPSPVASTSDAVVLFAEVARAVDPGFDVDRHLGDVISICRTVDGLPLAIKLAAGHVRTLPPPLLRTRLRARLGSPGGASRDSPARQMTIPATIDWSLDLLGGAERRLFARLGVFASPAALEEIEEICGEPGEDVVEALSVLVDQSLLQRTEGTDGGLRFRMLELVRERARELLDAGPDTHVLRARHCAHVIGRLERIETERWTTLAGEWIGMITGMLAEVRAAHAWATRQGDVVDAARIAASLGTYWHREGHHIEARRWVESLQHLDALDDSLGARLLAAAAFLSWTNDPLRAREYWREAAGRFRRAGDDRYLAYCLGLAAGTHIGEQEGYEHALGLCDEALTIARSVGDRPLVAQVLNVLGELARVHGDDNLAYGSYVEGMGLAADAGDRAHHSVFLANLAYIADHRGDYHEARRLTCEALRVCWSLGLRMMAAWTVSEMAGPQLGLGHPEVAALLVGASDRALATLGVERHLGDQNEHERVVTGLSGLLGEEAYRRLTAQGATLTLERAVALALSSDADLAEQGQLALTFADFETG